MFSLIIVVYCFMMTSDVEPQKSVTVKTTGVEINLIWHVFNEVSTFWAFRLRNMLFKLLILLKATVESL